MRLRAWLLGLAGVVVAGGVAFAAISYHPAIDPIAPPSKLTFAPEVVARGAELAAIGDCAVCHTASGGRRLAGGRAVPTPFGTVYATNITPDAETGIGGWSEAAFRRAMRDGIARDGSHLYPVLPYPHFTRATDADIGAIYAYLMTRAPVRATAPANELAFPLDQRALLAGWNLLFLRPGAWQPDPGHDAAWNQGAYLVEAVGHCGACHSPRNPLGAEERVRLSGGAAEGWYAPPLLHAASPAPVAWTQAQLATYLRTGFASEHGASAGPMTAVTEELAYVPDADVRAIAVYMAALLAPPGGTAPVRAAARTAPEGGLARAAPEGAGHTLFAGACGACHGDDAPMTVRGANGGIPSISLNTGANADTPMSLVQVILNGIPWREGKATPYMPAFGAALTDAQVAEIVAYVRARYTGKPAWSGVDDAIAKARKEGAT